MDEALLDAPREVSDVNDGALLHAAIPVEMVDPESPVVHIYFFGKIALTCGDVLRRLPLGGRWVNGGVSGSGVSMWCVCAQHDSESADSDASIRLVDVAPLVTVVVIDPASVSLSEASGFVRSIRDSPRSFLVAVCLAQSDSRYSGALGSVCQLVMAPAPSRRHATSVNDIAWTLGQFVEVIVDNGLICVDVADIRALCDTGRHATFVSVGASETALDAVSVAHVMDVLCESVPVRKVGGQMTVISSFHAEDFIYNVELFGGVVSEMMPDEVLHVVTYLPLSCSDDLRRITVMLFHEPLHS